MAADLIRINTEQDALVVILNFCSDRGPALGRWLKSRFQSGRECLYLEVRTFPSAEEVAKKIIAERDKYRVTVPPGAKLVFCFYLPLEDLTDEWMELYRRFPEDMDIYHPAKDGARHCYVTVLQYRIEQMLKEKKADVAERLQGFGADDMNFFHTQYLLYVPMTDTPDSQEQGIVQLLWLWSRKEGQQVAASFTTDAMRQLRVINYADYQESEDEECKSQIARLKSLLEEEADPNLNILSSRIVSLAQQLTKKVEDAIGRFEKLSPLYPVRVTDYQRKRFGMKYERCVETGPGSFLQRCRQNHIQETCQTLLMDTQIESFGAYVRKEYHIPDYKKLEQKLEDGSLEETLTDRVLSGKKDFEDDLECFLKEWFQNVKKILQDSIAGYKMKQKNLEYELEVQKARQVKAGKYRNLQDCLDRMAGEVKFLTPVKILPSGIATVVFVGGHLAVNWTLEGYDTEAAAHVYSCPVISPSDIAMLKEASYIELAAPNAQADLGRILY